MESTGGSEATTFKAPRRQRQKRAESDSARLGNCSVTDQGEFNRKLSWQGAKPRTPRRPMRESDKHNMRINYLNRCMQQSRRKHVGAASANVSS